MQNEQVIFEQSGDDNTLGGRINKARHIQGLSLSQVSRQLGVKTSTLQAWEKDRSEPRANKLVQLSGILATNPMYLINGMGNAPQYENVPQELRDLKAQVESVKRNLSDMTETVSRMERLIDHALKIESEKEAAENMVT